MIIGIIDSGKGGLAVAKKIKKEEDQMIVLLDQAFFPYGRKSKEFLLKRAYYLTSILLQMNAELIIIACNTLSIVALDFLKSCFHVPILGVFHYFIPYLTSNNTLIGSKTTITYAKKNYPVQVLDGTDFIEAIENHEDFSNYIENLKGMACDNLLLGCTHFLVVEEEAFPLKVIHQIPMLEEDIKKTKYSHHNF